MKLIAAIVTIAATVSALCVAAAQTVPLPPQRPAEGVGAQALRVVDTLAPSACRLRLTEELAVAPSLTALFGPGECGAPDIVRLETIILPDKSRVDVNPPAILRCTMAEAIVNWVREDAAPLAVDHLGALRAIQNFDSYDCRGRNRIIGAKTSEHGKGNALDIRAIKLANGKSFELTDPHVARDFREAMRKSICARFTTVLGPGSDGYHENHVHMDLAERRGGYRLCQWDVRDPQPEVAAIPLPRPRPAIDEATSARKL